MTHTGFLTLTISLCVALPAAAQYSSRQDGDVVRLEDAKNQTVVGILTSVGNRAFEMKVKGQNVLYFPYASIEEFKARPGLSGIPFLGPWANRLDEQAFYANGKKYSFNMELGNVTGARPIHGFLATTDQWQVTEVKSDGNSAWVTSRLDFYKHPQWMAQFPFAHTIEMTYRLRDGALEVNTVLRNLSTDPMPVAIGYHPYFRVSDAQREEWTLNVGARAHWLLNPDKIPTGETEPIEKFFPNPKTVALKDYSLDHVFGDLSRDASGRASVAFQGKAQKVEVMLGPNYRALVMFSPGASGAGNGRGGGRGPQDRNFIALEPMAGITDSMNLAHKGLYKELQYIAPGGTWQESFWVRPSGF